MIRFLVLPLVFLAVSCSGGGGEGSAPPPSGPVQLAFSLATTGVALTGLSNGLLAGYAIVNSAEEYRQLMTSRRSNSADIAVDDNLDFTQHSIVYLEGSVGDFLGSAVRIDQITRTDGNDRIFAERCTVANDPGVRWSPYAIYVTAKISGTAPLLWTAPSVCATLTAVDTTFVTDSQFMVGTGVPQVPYGTPVAIRTQAQLDALLPSFPAIPPAYRAPDFTKLTLLVVVGPGDWDANSYVRAFRTYENRDGSLDVVVEYCGYSLVGVASHQPYALYAVPRTSSVARQAVIEHEPGGCLLPR